MSTQRKPVHAYCGHQGCGATTFFEAYTRRDAVELSIKYGQGKWRCVRHASENEVLSITQPRRVTEIVSRQEPHGRYWGNSGFHYGLGFKAFCADFPAGSILRVTAEIIVPEARPEQGKDQ